MQPSVIPLLNVGQRKGSDFGTGRKRQPRSMAGIARSRRPFLVMLSGAFEKRLPERRPVFDANAHRFRALHATDASRQISGASSPLSAASTASLRTAVIRAMDTEPSPHASRAPSHLFTVALVKPSRGSSPNRAMRFAACRGVHGALNRGIQH
jgi:hypothetical protein